MSFFQIDAHLIFIDWEMNIHDEASSTYTK